jgi:hypothetical protein
MVHVSQKVNKKSKNIENELEPNEKDSLLPFIPEFFVESFTKGRAEGIAEGKKRGEKRGMEKVLLAYIAKNPMLSDLQIAESFDIEVAFVQRLRKKVK